MKMVSDFKDGRFCPKGIKKVFSFSLNPTAWIKESENSLDVKNIFILPDEQIMLNGKYNKVILGREYLEESLIFLDGYDELYLKLQEYSKGTILFLEDLKNLAKSWNLKIIVTSRKTCINPSELYKYGYKVCQLAKLTEEKQEDWINNVYNTKLFPENPYNIEKIYSSFQENNIQSKVLELLEIPILLQLIVSKYFYGGAQNIVELYDILFKEILNTRKEMTIGSFDEDKTEEFKKIFELYAYDIYKNNDNYAIVASKELEKEENTKWKSLLLFYITSEKKQKEYYIEFVHRSFYQYFQAWYFYNLILDIVNKKGNVANLFQAIRLKKIERDVINMIGQISQNQKQIQNQEQINYILNTFEKTNGIIKNTKNNEWCVSIGSSNVVNEVENILYNLVILLKSILSNTLEITENSKISELIKKFNMNYIYLPKSNIKLKGKYLKGEHLEGTDLSNTNLTQAHLKMAHLEMTYLEKANLTEANLIGAHLEGANLTKADLTGANLTGANLTKTDLTGTDLKLSDLTRTNLTWANLAKADLTKAIFAPVILKDAILEDTKISREKYNEIVALGIDVNKIIWCN